MYHCQVSLVASWSERTSFRGGLAIAFQWSAISPVALLPFDGRVPHLSIARETEVSIAAINLYTTMSCARTLHGGALTPAMSRA